MFLEVLLRYLLILGWIWFNWFISFLYLKKTGFQLTALSIAFNYKLLNMNAKLIHMFTLQLFS